MKNKKRYKIIIAVLFLLLIAGLTCYLLFQDKGLGDDENAIDYEGKLSQSGEVEKDRIMIPGYGTLQMEADTDVLKVVLSNAKDNPCYFKFTIILDETDEVLYESKLVAPGKAVVEEKLKQTLTHGTHPITIRIQTFTLDDRNIELNGSEVKTSIVTYTKDQKE